MDIQEIYNLMERFECSNIGELELEMHGAKLALKKSACCIGMPNTAQSVLVNAADAAVQGGNGQGSVAQKDANSVQIEHLAAKKQNVSEIKAPLLGTFYRAPSPEDKPYVMIGQAVKKGDVIGIIEAMKLMNEIVAPCDGVVETIDAENGTMVEYNQVLVTLSRSK